MGDIILSEYAFKMSDFTFFTDHFPKEVFDSF